MIERRDTERREGRERRVSKDRRISSGLSTQWLQPYGRRKLDTSDSRKCERRQLDRRVTN